MAALTFRCRFTRYSRRRRFICVAFVLAVIYALYVLFQWSNLIGEAAYNLGLSCEKLKSREQLAALCADYNAGHVGGNLCHDLCTTKVLVLPGCLAHKNTTIVFTGTWRGIEIAFKTKAKPHQYQNIDEILFGNEDKTIQSDMPSIVKGFSQYLHDYIKSEIKFNDLEKHLTPAELLEKLYYPHSTENLSLADVRSLWKLIQRDEFIKFQLLRELIHIPKVYGFCGSYYAVEQVHSLEEYISPFGRPKTWDDRANVAREVLELFMEFRSTFLGKLTHCDIQPGNFGVNNKGKVLAIDVDTVFNMPQTEEIMSQGKCLRDEDCSFFDCMSACNKATGTCTSIMITNNLHVVCRDLYLLNSWVMPGLLNMSPIYAANKLKPVLEKCSAARTLPWTSDKEKALYDELHSLLTTDLE